jgi:hypothetical protein
MSMNAPQGYSAAYHQNVNNAANNAANQAYQQSLARNADREIALKEAQFAWSKVVDEAGLTGMYQGGYTMPVQQWQAETFGTWGAPTAGQQTLGAQQQQFGQGATLAGLYGQYYAPGEAPTSGTQTLAAQQQQFGQGLQTQQEQRAAQAQQQSQAQAYLNLLAGLRGPADWAKYQQVLGATPGGMRDLYAAAMGQYVPGGGATTGVAPEAASLQSMMGQISGQGYNPAAAGQPLNTPNVYGQNSQGMYAQLQGQPTAGQQAMQTAQQNVALDQQAMQARNAQGGGTNTMGATQPQYQQNLPAPNQIAPQSWANMAPSQREMLMGQYEASGWHKPDVEALFSQSLPKYAANAPSAGTFRLGR